LRAYGMELLGPPLPIEWKTTLSPISEINTFT
jgi:hypothetical protein